MLRASVPALIAGVVFGAGLALGDMVNPARVLGFLDIAGVWDPALAFVMGGAVLASAVGYSFSRRLSQPLFGRGFFIPENRRPDTPLIAGAALFGIGWALVGFCPGPAIAGLVYGVWQAWVFVASMIVGMGLQRLAAARPAARQSPRADA